MEFPAIIDVLGSTYNLVSVHRTARGFIEAQYYCLSAPAAQFVTIRGDFVSPSI